MMENFDLTNNTEAFYLLVLLSLMIFCQLYFLIISHKRDIIFSSITVFFVTYFLIHVWIILPSLLGYPYKTNALPDEFQLIDYVELPREGKLLIWLTEEDAKRPRVYEIKMNESLKKNMRKAKKNGAHSYSFVKISGKSKRLSLESEKYDLRLKIKPTGIFDYKKVDKQS